MMGAVWARFRGRKRSTEQMLEEIAGRIEQIEGTKRDCQAQNKWLVGYILAYFSVFYVVAAAVAYFNLYRHPDWQDLPSRLKLFSPFLVAPLLFLLVKRALSWWYRRKLARNESDLDALRKRKAKLLEDVMETETYKVAKAILDKYGGPGPAAVPGGGNRSVLQTPGGSALRPAAAAAASASTPSSPAARGKVLNDTRGPRGLLDLSRNIGGESWEQQQVRRRRPVSGGLGGPPDPRPQQQQLLSTTTRLNSSSTSSLSLPAPEDTGKGTAWPRSTTAGSGAPLVARGLPPMPLPRPVLPRERGYMDRVVDYLVGDGPANRFALICKQCQSHNGMALREEFEYIAYRCCYCFYWNPARKQKPSAPRLLPDPGPTRALVGSPTISGNAGLPATPGPRSRTSSSSSSSSASAGSRSPQPGGAKDVGRRGIRDEGGENPGGREPLISDPNSVDQVRDPVEPQRPQDVSSSSSLEAEPQSVASAPTIDSEDGCTSDGHHEPESLENRNLDRNPSSIENPDEVGMANPADEDNVERHD